MSTKEVLNAQEAQFNASPALALLQFQRGDISTKQMILQKLKTLKSVARLLSKHSWRQWRLERQEKLNVELEKTLAIVSAAWDPLQQVKNVSTLALAVYLV